MKSKLRREPINMIEEIIDNYSEDHILKQVYINRNMRFPKSFLEGLDNALLNLKVVSKKLILIL